MNGRLRGPIAGAPDAAAPRSLAVALAVTLFALAAWAGSAGDDRAVVATALDHFADRTDAHFYDASARLAIQPRTERVRSAGSAYENFSRAQGDCPVERPVYEAYAKRNSESRPIGDLLGESGKWRRVRPDEEKTISPVLPPPPGVKRAPLKTLVTLTWPAYSADGSLALVVFWFNWSIHGAEARYVLGRTEGRWAVRCSQLVFYP